MSGWYEAIFIMCIFVYLFSIACVLVYGITTYDVIVITYGSIAIFIMNVKYIVLSDNKI